MTSVVRRRARQQEPLLAALGYFLSALGRSGAPLGHFLAALGRSWLLLGRSWVALGRSLAPLGRSRAALGTARKNQSKIDAKNDRFGRPKAFQNDAKIEQSIKKTKRKRTELRHK